MVPGFGDIGPHLRKTSIMIHPVAALTQTRRQFLLSTALLGAAVALPFGSVLAQAPQAGGSITINIGNEPPVLVLIAHTSGQAVYVSGKITEGLLTYDFDFNPQPQLATAWTTSEDGLHYRFKLREGVKWHDGKDFTAEDVAYSILALKQYHPRGAATFSAVAEAKVLGLQEVELVLSKPAPFLISALAASESPIVPKHIYDIEGTLPADNPATYAPIGTGPFVFGEWVRGSHIILKRNPDYWDQPKPYLDQVVYRFIGDPAAAVAALETGEVNISTAAIPLTEIARLQQDPRFGFETRGFGYGNGITRAEFNLDNPYLANLQVRQAIAHAIDRNVIVDTVYRGYAKALLGPINPNLTRFYEADLPSYAYDPAKAEALLDAAGYPRGADGKRFSIFVDLQSPAIPTKQTGEYFVQALNAIGIDAQLRSQDYAAAVKRVYTDRDFDLVIEGMSNLFDPTVGVQRLYWSKNFKIGLPFSNGSHYDSAEADRLLEAAAVEVDPDKRKALFTDFQKQVIADVPAIDLVAPDSFVIYDKRVLDHTIGVDGIGNNGASIHLAS